ncbi:unnamed protein product [Chrysoparadoxa australica]
MPEGSIIIGVDILPIRPIRGVKTLVHDITTQECRVAIKKELQTWQADVVLCDGAPNVGTAFNKDAYEQNELALAALRVATQHLTKGGTFVTKVYRSQDYNSFVWALQQFFESYHAVKPASSRSQSAEIFLVGVGYLAPDSIDPRMLDPEFVFNQDFEEGMKKGVNIFHKKYDQHNKRKRGGYSDDLGMTMTRTATATTFVEAEDPVQLLTDTHVIKFGPGCEVYRSHAATTPLILTLCEDLRILGKGDFKSLLKWRLALREYRAELLKAGEESSEEEEKVVLSLAAPVPLTEEEQEQKIQDEIKDLRLQMLAEKKRDKKKARAAAAKLRERIAMGMEAQGAEAPQEPTIFSLATLKKGGDVEAVREVSLAELKGMQVSYSEEESEEEEEAQERGSDYDSDAEAAAMLEEDLEAAYNTYLSAKDKDGQAGTRMAKRSKKVKDAKAAEEMEEDATLYDGDQQRYLEMLAGKGKIGHQISMMNGDEEDSCASSGSDSETEGGGLISGILDGDEKKRAITSQWFDNDIFAGAEEALEQAKEKDRRAAEAEASRKAAKQGGDGRGAKRARQQTSSKAGSDDEDDGDSGDEVGVASQVLASMPMTDKEKRKEKRKKAAERRERSVRKRDKALGDDALHDRMEVVPADDALENMDREARAKALKAREMIKRGMGRALTDGDEEEGFEVEPAEYIKSVLPRMDDSVTCFQRRRKYDSEEELYDDEDRARQLALGTMILRKHRAKEMVDASYNRYAWNDPKNLPDWFLDDETKHNRPQVPIPSAVMEQMRAKFISLASKPIKKASWHHTRHSLLADCQLDLSPTQVAEARARKRKRAAQKLTQAKKQATALASNPDMTERQKLKAVQKAMSKGHSTDKPSKMYVVAKKRMGGKPSAAGKKPGGAKVIFRASSSIHSVSSQPLFLRYTSDHRDYLLCIHRPWLTFLSCR